MSVALVVPVTRLRRDTRGWSYRLPADLVAQAGSLVVVPFRGRPTLGVVWEVTDKDARASEQISQVLTPLPLLRAPHRETVEWLSQAGLCSLSTALYVWLPRALRALPLTASTKQELERFNRFSPDARSIAQSKQHLVCMAGRRPDQEARLVDKFGDRFAALFNDRSEPLELRQWVDIATGRLQVGLGREGALCAPWLNLRQITVVEPEDISFYHEQTPYLSLVDLGRELARAHRAELTVRSYLPQEAAEAAWGPGASGTELAGQVRLVDLRKEPLLSPELIQAIRATLGAGKRALLLHNGHDRLVEDEDRTRKLLPGIETLRRQLAQALGSSELPPGVTLDTRSLFHRPQEEVGLTVILNIDALLRAELFADRLHGWTDLGHLLTHPAPCWIQTYRPDHPLIRALANDLLPSYAAQEIGARREAGLPPFAEVVVCSYKGTDPQEAEQLYERLQPLGKDPWQLSHPFTGRVRKDDFTHLMLIAPPGTRLPAAARSLLVSLKRPWRVQHNPWYIL